MAPPVPSNVNELEYHVERAKTSRSRCGRSSCQFSNKNKKFIPRGHVRIAEKNASKNEEHFYCLQPKCFTQRQAMSVMECGKYETFADVPGMGKLPEDMREAAITTLEAIKENKEPAKDVLDKLQQRTETKRTPSKGKGGKKTPSGGQYAEDKSSDEKESADEKEGFSKKEGAASADKKPSGGKTSAGGINQEGGGVDDEDEANRIAALEEPVGGDEGEGSDYEEEAGATAEAEAAADADAEVAVDKDEDMGVEEGVEADGDEVTGGDLGEAADEGGPGMVENDAIAADDEAERGDEDVEVDEDDVISFKQVDDTVNDDELTEAGADSADKHGMEDLGEKRKGAAGGPDDTEAKRAKSH